MRIAVSSRSSFAWTACALASLLAAAALSAAPRDASRTPGSRFRDCPDICPEMVVIRAGSFLMGAPPGDPHRQNEEQPEHRVDIAYAFAVGRYEVTRDEYAAFVSDTGLADPEGCNVHEPPRWPTIMVCELEGSPGVCELAQP